jgi:PAS domain S-box-containing protein
LKQRTLTGSQRLGKTTRRARFLADMDRLVPWAELEGAIQNIYPKRTREAGAFPVTLPRMLRLYLLQLWFDLSDAALEDALYDSATMREFAGVDPSVEAIPDEATIGKFRELLAHHGIGEQILTTVHGQLKRSGVKILHERIADPGVIEIAQAPVPAQLAPAVTHVPTNGAAHARTNGMANGATNGATNGASPVTQKPSVHGSPDPVAMELALTAMGVGVFEFDLAAGVFHFGDRCKSILGLPSHEEPTPERIHSLVHPDDQALTGAAVCNSLKPDGPGAYSIEHRVMGADGDVRWVQVCGQTVFEETPAGRRPVRILGTMLDITERRLTELKLNERDSQLRTFIEDAPASIAMFDREMCYLAVSRRYAEDRGVSPSEIIGRSFYEVFPHTTERWKGVHARCLADATERCDLDIMVRPDGTKDWIRWEVRPWYDADRTVGGLILFSEIITQRLQGERQLRESEARLELAVRAGALGIYDYSIADDVHTWDSRVRELWGVGPTEPITSDVFLSGLHPEDRAPTQAALAESLRPDGNGRHAAEYRVVNRRDGSTRWISSTGAVFFESGRAVRLVGVVQDITERKRAVLALAESAEELREADHRKDAFLATLSHELRNPLAPIRTAAQILASPKLTDEQLRWARQVIQRQTAHMASLLDDLLEVARITRGKLSLRMDRATLASIVDSAVEASRPLLDEKQHRLTVSVPENAVVFADPLRLSQVLSNLLANAAKYTDCGGHIELTARIEGPTLHLSVRDDGIGIPQEALGQIFTMFWQLGDDAGRSAGGLGIGLAFVKGLVELHGGTIEARSAGPGTGSEFIVRLPVVASAPVESPPQSATQAMGATGCRVLVADDNRDAADSLAMLLTLAHHEVRVAHSGLGAITAARAFRPDVALLDIGMPELDGYDVARALRQEPWGAGVRLVALTGWGQEDDKQRATDAGFDYHLTKPVDPETLELILSMNGVR